jgi:hypothetical protein
LPHLSPKEDGFFYNQKINCMRAAGKAEFEGKTYTFSPIPPAVRWIGGVEYGPYSNTWYWGSASGQLNGVRLALIWGTALAILSAAVRICFFTVATAHKLDQVLFNIRRTVPGRMIFFLPGRSAPTTEDFDDLFPDS